MKKPHRFLELKNTRNELRNAIESINSRIDQAKEAMYELEGRTFDINQSLELKKKIIMKNKSEEMCSMAYHQKKQSVNY